jgi:hypothetical protein
MDIMDWYVNGFWYGLVRYGFGMGGLMERYGCLFG